MNKFRSIEAIDAQMAEMRRPSVGIELDHQDDSET